MAMNDLLKFIRTAEARGNYNAIWLGIKHEDYPTKPLTEMTVKEVLDWQHSIDAKYRSEAAGAYQILEDTLRRIMKSRDASTHGWEYSDLFDAARQDNFALLLIRGRGLQRYLDWHDSAEIFCSRLAMEWASLPLVSGPRKGHGYYDGDGLNKSNADPDEFLKIVRRLR